MPAKAPPLPLPPITKYESNATLVELPYFYLLERGHWSDFRRALNNCGLTWNLPDWMCTIVYKGADYKELRKLDGELDEIFKLPTVSIGEEKLEVGGSKSKSLIKLLGFPRSMSDYIQVSTKYCNLSKLEFEPDSKLPARQKLWSWIVKCLQGTKLTPGPYYYLINQVPVYDISQLFKKLMAVIETVTICSLDDEVYNVTHLEFDPSRHDLFGYLEELRKAVQKLADLNERLPEEGRVILSEAYIRSRLVRAARQLPTYKSVIDNLVIQPIEIWSKMTLEELCKKLESAHANDLSLIPKRSTMQNYQSSVDDQVKANYISSKAKQTKKSTKSCYEFDRTGSCKRGNACNFIHQQATAAKPAQNISEKTLEQKNPSPAPQPQAAQNANPRPCKRCNLIHKQGECKNKDKCMWCTKDGHREDMCHSKKAGKPKILFSNIEDDGAIVQANLFICEVDLARIDSQLGTLKPKTLSEEVYVEQNKGEIFSNAFLVEEKNTYVQNVIAPTDIQAPPPPQGMVIEKFYADTGANRSVHPNNKAADKYFPLALDISTAAGSKSMKSEGVGTMKLFAPSGEQIFGFERVIFCKNVSEKLCSVGELADAGYICVFDDKKLTTYSKKDFKVVGKTVTVDLRDTRTKLYPITFYRNIDGDKDKQTVSVMNANVNSITPSPSLLLTNFSQQNKLPSEIPDAPISAALLAKTYKHPNLNEVDKYHAKLGDIGIKYMKRCLPNLKLPSQYRCDVCISGKIHKFGHKACAEGVRREFLPGVCIHSDHSGPYAKSLSGARYSQLYLDRGSGYLWSHTQKFKTEHYTSTPAIFTDAWAISGRKVQVFQTDGDGVFASAETRQLLETERVRHEWSAPYDSDTNAFIERARRTVFEGVCTALLRAGAPARFWGEAECHKIYTLNLLPTLPDPEKEGAFCSRRNLLEGSRRPPDLERLMAFGTAATCFVPKERRTGGKEPAQRRSFHGVILGYAGNMPAYRIWDLEIRKIRLVSYNFTICHEGYYPFRDKLNWPEEFFGDPENFTPTIGGVITRSQLRKFEFEPDESSELAESAPDLTIIDAPQFEVEKTQTEKFYDSKLLLEPPKIDVSTPPTTVQAPPNPPITPSVLPVQKVFTPNGPGQPGSRLREFWQSVLDKQNSEGGDTRTQYSFSVIPFTSLITLLDPRTPAQLSPLPCVTVAGTKEGGEGGTPKRSKYSPGEVKCAKNCGENYGMSLFTPSSSPATSDMPPLSKNSLRTTQNFTSVSISPKENVPNDPFLKPIGIPPPATLR
jgi:transposase InsO family protein